MPLVLAKNTNESPTSRPLNSTGEAADPILPKSLLNTQALDARNGTNLKLACTARPLIDVGKVICEPLVMIDLNRCTPFLNEP